jgi:hypothetical protein
MDMGASHRACENENAANEMHAVYIEYENDNKITCCYERDNMMAVIVYVRYLGKRDPIAACARGEKCSTHMTVPMKQMRTEKTENGKSKTKTDVYHA